MKPYPLDIREEELKLRVAKDFFPNYDTANILGSIDFCVAMPKECTLFQDEIESLVWAEAKQGNTHNIYHSFVQLILTIGKARTFDKHLPPRFLAAFDCQRLAFIPYHNIQDVFYLNDFNWNVTPSDHNSKEFQMLFQLVEKTLKQNAFIYNYDTEEKELRKFIKQNIVLGNRKTKRHLVTKNNFTFVYQRWCEQVKQSIQIDWDAVKRVGLLDADFFLADLLSKDGTYLLENLFVLLKHDHYQFDRNIDPLGLYTLKEAAFKDNMQAHIAFWNKYERPPKREYWGYIVERRDLLVPQDVRERKGSFFTPKQWVELSQEYLAKTLGENWQDNYYVWDCCAGTGNLLNGLTNPRRVWASTLDKADVDVMHERVRNGASLFDNHIFQFDFLNDPFSKLPTELQEIIYDPNKRKQLVIYINPPYAEHGNRKLPAGTGENKTSVATETIIYQKYHTQIGTAARELYAQFLIRIYFQLSGCVIAQFSTLKGLQAVNFKKYRTIFQPTLKNLFLVPANSFDNVDGKFPIGFFIWDSSQVSSFMGFDAEVYNSKKEPIGIKKVYSYDSDRLVIEWLRQFFDKKGEVIGYLRMKNTDIQNKGQIFITSIPSDADFREKTFTYITPNNLIPITIYLVIRCVIEGTWLNNRDQYLYPSDDWKDDKEFQLDCLIYALFCNQNHITNKGYKNHWLPFYEHEIGITECFDSHFMQDFIQDFLKGKARPIAREDDLFASAIQNAPNGMCPLQMTAQAQAVLNAGKEVYKYYYAVRKQNGGGTLNAALYDIKEYFKGRNEKGNIKATSDDAQFNRLMETLRTTMQALAQNITPKIYQYGFLK